jgi:PII-like signaling protein
VNIPLAATLLRVYLNASDRLHGKAIYQRVVETARAMHLAGASVFLVDFSYGAHRQLRDAKSDYLSFHIPVVVEVVESPENVTKLLHEIDPLVVEGLVVCRPVRVVHYAENSTTEEQDPPTNTSSTGRSVPDSGSSSIMKIEGDAQRLSVYIGSSDTWRGRNLVTAIVEKCRELGIAGATATTGTMGFGKTSRIHRAHLLGLSEDMPERIEIIDRPERIAMLLPHLKTWFRED